MCKRIDAPVHVQSQYIAENVEVRDGKEFITPECADPDGKDEGDHDRGEHVDSVKKI